MLTPSLLIEVPKSKLEQLLQNDPSLRENLARQFRRFKELAEVGKSSSPFQNKDSNNWEGEEE